MSGQRRLSKNEQAAIISRYGMRCFIDDQLIMSADDLEFDTLAPPAAHDATPLEHLVPVCRSHRRQKGALTLTEYRDSLQLEAFFAAPSPRYLDDIIRAKGCTPGQPLPYTMTADAAEITLAFPDGAKTVSLYTCPVTAWPYFYALIPIQHLQNDRSLQPRPLRHLPL